LVALDRARPAKIRVRLVGPHVLINQALGQLLSALPGFELAPDEAESSVWQADLVLLILPELSDLEPFIRQHPQARVLLLSLDWTPAEARIALQAGAAGCLDFDQPAEALGRALHQAARGEVELSDASGVKVVIRLGAGEWLDVAALLAAFRATTR